MGLLPLTDCGYTPNLPLRHRTCPAPYRAGRSGTQSAGRGVIADAQAPRTSSSSRRRADLDLAPVMRLTGCPSENSNSAGIAVIWYSAASSWLASTSTFATVNLSDSAPASSSNTGAIMVQGRHQVAQKSTRTGLDPLAVRTVSEKSSSVTSMMLGVWGVAILGSFQRAAGGVQ